MDQMPDNAEKIEKARQAHIRLEPIPYELVTAMFNELDRLRFLRRRAIETADRCDRLIGVRFPTEVREVTEAIRDALGADQH